MKPEVSERLLIQELFMKSQKKETDLAEILSIDKLTGDASTRRYYRVFTQDNSYVVCLDEPTQMKNKFVEVLEFLQANEVSVPRLIDMDLAKGYLLEEDLGDTTLLNRLSTVENEDEELQLYKSAIDEIALMHSIPKNIIDESKKFGESFDYQKLKEEIDFSIKFFLQKLLEIDDEQVLEKIRSGFDSLCQALGQQEMVLTHRDFHSRNIMFKKDELKIIDFQDARWGVPQYDLASLLDDCYYSISSEKKDILKSYYLEKMGTRLSKDTIRDFDYYYAQMAIQRTFKAIGSFSYIYALRKDLRYLKYIGFAMEKLKTYLFKCPQLKELRTSLLEIYYEN